MSERKVSPQAEADAKSKVAGESRDKFQIRVQGQERKKGERKLKECQLQEKEPGSRKIPF